MNSFTGFSGRNGGIVAIVGTSFIAATGIAGVSVVTLWRALLVSRDGSIVTAFGAGLLLVAGGSGGGHGRDTGGGGGRSRNT